MPFQPGNKLTAKRKNHNGGRPSNQKREIQKAAREIARDYIEASVKPVMMTYFQLAHGRLVNKYHEGKVIGQEFEADAATTRHFIDKILPPVQKIQAQVEEVPRHQELIDQVRRTPEGRAAVWELVRQMREAAKPAIDVTGSREE